MKNFLKSESGQALAVMAICMTTLAGFLGLATDVGLLYHDKQNEQIAADAAALAATQEYMYSASISSGQTAGKAASAANGFTDGSDGTTVTINLPPQSGPNQNPNYAEAIISKSTPLSFLRILGNSNATVSARAVAGMPLPGNTCLWLMASTGVGMDVQGSYDIEATTCGIYVNSKSSDAVSVTGNGGTMNVKFLDAVGDVTPQHQTSPTPITDLVAPRTNPWGNTSGPTYSGSGSQCSITDSSSAAITTTNESTVQGSAINNVVCFTKAVSLDNGVSLPGASSGVVYVFENGVTIPTGATVTFGSGTYNAGTRTFSSTIGAVMDLPGGTLNQASSSVLNIYAPTAGSYNGLAILQPASNTTELQVQFGSNNETLDGNIFAPGAEVYLQDHGGGITAMGIVADYLYDKSSTIRIPGYDTANSTTTPDRTFTIVE